MAVTAANLLSFLGQQSDTALLAQAGQILTVASAMIGAYCRGNHLNAAGQPRAGVDEVTLTVAARLYANPEQIAYDSGSVGMRGGLVGFTLVELAVLNRYRKKAT